MKGTSHDLSIPWLPPLRLPLPAPAVGVVAILVLLLAALLVAAAALHLPRGFYRRALLLVLPLSRRTVVALAAMRVLRSLAAVAVAVVLARGAFEALAAVPEPLRGLLPVGTAAAAVFAVMSRYRRTAWLHPAAMLALLVLAHKLPLDGAVIPALYVLIALVFVSGTSDLENYSREPAGLPHSPVFAVLESHARSGAGKAALGPGWGS